jgi:Xaa-Pro dipeptidase
VIIERIQQNLRQVSLDGWLFFDHHRRDPLAYRILGIPDAVEATRRWYYFVPAQGEPRKLVHRIESGALASLAGDTELYSRWTDQQQKLNGLLAGSSRIAMQYSPECAIPYVSLVDAGTVELIRGFGIEIVSSGDLIQEFEARWSEEQLKLHLEAGKLVDQVRRETFNVLGNRMRSMEPVTEFEVQQFILSRFSQVRLRTTHGPIVGVNANASDPHYEPRRDKTSRIRAGDLVLVDLWAKLDEPSAVYYDITWTAFCGETVPEQIRNVFDIVKNARKKASSFVMSKASSKEFFAGYEVDDVARHYIEQQGFGDFFFHRTGHSIGTDVHGTGANMDNFESHDERRVIPGTCFSIEPGIYLPEFGIRSEVNVYVGDGFAQVTGEEQEDLVRI